MSDDVEVELNFGPPPPRCKLCRREKGQHKAHTFHCPIGRGNFPSYSTVNTYTPSTPRAKKSISGL